MAALSTAGSLPASVINLHQAYDEQRKGVGSWKVVGANALNVGVGVAASGVALTALLDPSYQTAALVGLGLSAGTNVLTGVINYAKDMGSTHKQEPDGSTGVAMRALGQQAKRNWKSGLAEGAKFAALGAAAGAVGTPVVGALGYLGISALSEIGNVVITILTMGFEKGAALHSVMPNLLDLATSGGAIGAAVGLTAGIGVGLFPQIKRALARPGVTAA